MKVFMTGASGYIGSAVARTLVASGHDVTGLARSTASADILESFGVRARLGDLGEPQTFLPDVVASQAVIHLPLAHDFGGGAEIDRAATRAMLTSLAGTRAAFVYTSGTRVYGDTGPATVDEDDPPDPAPALALRVGLEQAVLAAADDGVRSVVIRPGLTYGLGGSGVFEALMRQAASAGISRYIASGENAWSLVHVEDLADLYLTLITLPGGTLLNAVGDGPVLVRDIAEAIGDGLLVPTESVDLAAAVAEWGDGLAHFVAENMRVADDRVRSFCAWRPRRPGVLKELRRGSYAAVMRAMANRGSRY